MLIPVLLLLMLLRCEPREVQRYKCYRNYLIRDSPYGTPADKYMNAYIENGFVFLGFLVNGVTVANTRYASRFTSSTTITQEVGFTFINNSRYVLTQISNGSAGALTFGMLIQEELETQRQHLLITMVKTIYLY